ncbi:hypothetical protein N7537_004516 [Penicillium hordei]|uniref:Mid2 domain-containing protein n=1 Tax=Penicillium hordei TaxID=40994 RepID=A0AAD6ECP1_9EURO|nr:uncharacterized protein N7537_004516 [Penicillium hordei]KAJ5607897.1 hypothetical protein N7537_004516 [Penicillium hordei]
MSTDEYLEGYSMRRNGSCAGGETDCGKTWDSFRRCCPGNTECPAQPNSPGICCPTTKNCKAALDNKWRCADPTADLYFVEKTEGYFCCANDTRGLYTVSRNYAACAKAEDMNDLGVEVKTMKAIVQYTLPASTSSNIATTTTLSSSTSGTITATSTSSNNANTDTSHSNTGAIAGGVVGGIAGVIILIGLAWCLFRRRKKHPQDSQSIQPPPGPASELSGSNQITELSGQSIAELPGSEHRKSPPVELAT